MSSVTQTAKKTDMIIENVERLIRAYNEEVETLNLIQTHICEGGCQAIDDIRNLLNAIKINRMNNVNLSKEDIIDEIITPNISMLTNKFDYQIRNLVKPIMPIINAPYKSIFGESKNKQKARENSFKGKMATYIQELAEYNKKVNDIEKKQNIFISILKNYINDVIDTYITQNKTKKDLIGPYPTNSNREIVDTVYNDIVQRINDKQSLSKVRDDILKKYQSSLNTFIYGGKRYTKKRRSSSIKRKHRNRSSRVRK
jgi:hypothetical protein